MNKLVLTGSIILMFAICVGAQTRPRYVFDNFSTSGAVQPMAKTPASTQKSAPAKSLVKKTVQRTASVQDSYALSDTDRMGARPAVSNRPINNAKNSSRLSLHGNTTGSSEIDGYILDSCVRYEVDPLLIFAQMNQESSFKLRALSNKGASGLMQLMPATARRFGVTDIYDPQQNIEGGVRYMRWLLDTFNQDISLALAGYNAGEGAVMKYGYDIPPYNETQNYVRRISARYGALRGGSTIAQTTSVRRTYTPQSAPVQSKPKVQLSLYESSVVAVRTADGKMQLVNR